jgi:uncharacterized C2H2 Zn-finger protein
MCFLCRMPGCMFFGKNSQWVESRSSYHFKCPKCGELFRPWADYKGSVAASYVLSFIDPSTGLRVNMPTTWPPSEDMNWLNNQIEIYASNIQTDADLDAWKNKAALNLGELIEREAIPAEFQFFQWDADLVWRCPAVTWNSENLQEQGGFWGLKLTDESAARTPFANWSELIALVGNVVAANSQIN